MTFFTKIEFKKEEIKKFHYMIQHLQPLASELDEHDSDIWEYTMMCYEKLGSRIGVFKNRSRYSMKTNFNFSTPDRIVLYLDKIRIYFEEIIIGDETFKGNTVIYNLLNREIQFYFGDYHSFNPEEVEKLEKKTREERILEEEAWKEIRDESLALYEKLPKEYINSHGMEFVLIPAGEFLMGAVPQDREAEDYEKPQHKVRITKPFYIGKYPVTQGEWEGLMGNNPSKFKEAGKRAPVESVSWKDCREFIEKLMQKEGKYYDLPTEAEWEYSARGKSSTNPTDYSIYTYGDDPELLGDYAWFEDRTTHPVGEKIPNERGLHDMMGNVLEWCKDRFDENYYSVSPINDPKGSDEGGGSSLRGYCHLSSRYGLKPGGDGGGFRLVLKEGNFNEEDLKLNIERKKNIESNSNFYFHEREIEEIRVREVSERVWEASKKESSALYERLPKEITNSLGMEFVLIPAGEFHMGKVTQENPNVRITKPFYIGKYPVTQGEWEGLMGENPSYFKRAGKRAPVEYVSWNDCQEFIKKLNIKEGKAYRLPTEAEWEYSARGKSTSNSEYTMTYHHGGDIAWIRDNSRRTTHQVGSKKPNEFGMYDVLGNVLEWCADRFDYFKYTASPINDPKGPEKGDYRVLRGSCWSHVSYSLSDRFNRLPDDRGNNYGFRLVLLP